MLAFSSSGRYASLTLRRSATDEVHRVMVGRVLYVAKDAEFWRREFGVANWPSIAFFKVL